MGTMSTSGSTQPTQSRPMASRSDAGYRSDTYDTLPSLPPNHLWPSSRRAFAQAEDGVGCCAGTRSVRRTTARTATGSTTTTAATTTRGPPSPPAFPSGFWLTRARVRDRPSSNQQDGWGDAQDDMRQDDMRQDDSSREGHGDRAQSHARAGHSAAASSRRRRPRVRRPLPSSEPSESLCAIS